MATSADRGNPRLRRSSPDRRAHRLEEREVVSADPALSTETNARLTEEMREALGTDRATVPADRPHPSRGEQPVKSGGLAYLSQNRLQFVRATVIVLTFGAIVALITDDWWVLALAAGIHALGTMAVTLTVIGLTSVSEHPSPELSAAMSYEGVTSPDDRFSRMVDEFRPDKTGGDATGVLSPAADDRTADSVTDPATAGAEQSTAMTPTAAPSAPAEGGTPEYLIWATALSLAILSVVLPPLTGGGWMWLLTAVMLPLCAGWVVMQRALVAHGDAVQLRSRKPLIFIALCTAVAVAGFCALVALAFQH